MPGKINQPVLNSQSSVEKINLNRCDLPAVMGLYLRNYLELDDETLHSVCGLTGLLLMKKSATSGCCHISKSDFEIFVLL